ncbi:MAG: FAD-binding oxidoreductase [Janthinobacterium lividum]
MSSLPPVPADAAHAPSSAVVDSGDDVIARLRAALPADRIQTGEAINPRHETDFSRYPRHRPRALLLPRSTEDLSRMLAICHAFSQPVVPQGGLTGTNAGAQPEPQEIALTLERMVGVEEIDAAGVMTVLAGTPLETVQRAAIEAGWLCGIDIGSRGSCTIGGNVSTNAGGNNVIRYGMTRANVLGLEVVLADGRVLRSLNKMTKNTSGYDLKQLFIGSEGTLGVVTRVVLQLQSLPTSHECAFIAVSGYPAALRILRRAPAELAGSVSSFEILWPDCYDFMLDRVGLPAPLAGRHPLYLLLDVRGTDALADRERLERMLASLMEAGDVVDAAVAQSLADIERFWRLREKVSELHPYIPERSVFDVSFPLAAMEQAVDGIRDEIDRRWPGAVRLFFGHIGDGNVHIIVSLPDHAKPNATALDDLVFDAVRAHRGAVAAEHGIGRKRRPYLRHSRTAEEVAVMRELKATLDPRSILNPNKIF